MSAINLSATSPPPSAKKVKLSRSSFFAPLKVVVGPNAEEFFINMELICAQSKFFKAICREQWKSGRSRVVTLVEDDPTLFAIFLSWLTTGDIKSCSEFLEITTPPHADIMLIEQNYAQWEQLRRCYNLGDVLLAPSFKNAAMNLLIEASKSLLMSHNVFPCRTVQELETVYEATHKGSGLRKLIVDLAVKCLGIQSFADLDMSKPCIADFCTEVLSRTCSLLRDRDEEGVRDNIYLEYHWEHEATHYHDSLDEV